MATGGHPPKPSSRFSKKEASSCTVEELRGIITFQSGGQILPPTNELDEVSTRIFIGNGKVAKSRDKLEAHGITHVLNSAKGPKDCYHVNTSHVMYRPWNIEYLGIEANDMPSFKISQHFKKATEFIDNCMSSGGKILVHCVEGRSRSATLVIAYLMSVCHMEVRSAVREVRREREIYPNEGFLQQLCYLNDQLIKKGITLT